MDIITIDFTGCKQLYDIHARISEKLDFPEWYGQNLGALWDMLTGYIENDWDIYLKGCDDVSSELLPHMKKIVDIFREASDMYGWFKVHVIRIDFLNL